MLFAAANMDERRYPDPERFDLDRPPGGNLGWGNGPHTCVGIHLAKLEMAALLRALVDAGGDDRAAGPPTRIRNNTLQGIACAAGAAARRRHRLTALGRCPHGDPLAVGLL